MIISVIVQRYKALKKLEGSSSADLISPDQTAPLPTKPAPQSLQACSSTSHPSAQEVQPLAREVQPLAREEADAVELE